MTEKAKAARREYMRAWRRSNREKVAEHQKRYWEKIGNGNGGKREHDQATK